MIWLQKDVDLRLSVVSGAHAEAACTRLPMGRYLERAAKNFSRVPPSVRDDRVDNPDRDESRYHEYPIRDFGTRDRCFPHKPFHGIPPRQACLTGCSRNLGACAREKLLALVGPSGKHLGTGGRELHVGPALMPQQPTQRNRAGQSGAKLIRRATDFEERAI